MSIYDSDQTEPSITSSHYSIQIEGSAQERLYVGLELFIQNMKQTLEALEGLSKLLVQAKKEAEVQAHRRLSVQMGVEFVDSQTLIVKERTEECVNCYQSVELVTLSDACKHRTCLKCVHWMLNGNDASTCIQCRHCQFTYELLWVSRGPRKSLNKFPPLLSPIRVDLQQEQHRKQLERLEMIVSRGKQLYNVRW